MYNNYYGFRENPFSIAPDPRYLYLSEIHQDALAHLRFGAASKGEVILLIGEVGTGKTTLCRYFLEQIGPTAEIAMIINPGFGTPDLLATILDEFRIPVNRNADTEDYIEKLNQFLMTSHAANRETLLIIDEAQNLDKEALEILRLLTNLESDQHKLLKIFLLGQSELAAVLKGPDLNQLSQHITGSFHLNGLEIAETRAYIEHRLSVAGCAFDEVFSAKAIRRIHRLTDGNPRLINTLCDRSLLGAFSEDKNRVDEAIVKKAAKEIFGFDRVAKTIQVPVNSLVTTIVVLFLILGIWVGTTSDLFHLNLDSILAPSSSPNRDGAMMESPVEPEKPSPPEEIIRVETAEVAQQPTEPEPNTMESAPPVEAENNTIAEFTTEETKTEPEESDDGAAADESSMKSIFAAPTQIASEPEKRQETRIIIQHIEIND